MTTMTHTPNTHLTDAERELQAEGEVIRREELAAASAILARGRVDVHAPKAFDPAEYTEIGYFDNHPEEGGCWVDTAYNNKTQFQGNYQQKGRCDHCGAGPLRYGVVFYHEPTDETLVTGTTCAHRLGLGTRSQYDREQALAQAIRDAKVDRYRAANPDVAEFLLDALEGGTERFEFVLDIARKLRKYGDLSEKQTAAIRRIMDARFTKQAERELEPKPETPLAEGRIVVEGEILSHKWQEGIYGTAHKMLVQLDDLNKVWGTVPAAIEDAMYLPADDENPYSEVEDLKGHRVRFTATVERSRDDEHFGFYKRPTKPEVLTPVGAFLELKKAAALAAAREAHPELAAAADAAALAKEVS